MTSKDLNKKLKKYNKKQYLMLNVSLVLSIAFVSSYTFFLNSPLVLDVFPTSGSIRSFMNLIFIIVILGCWLFIIYAFSIFLKHKDKSSGIFIALGLKRKRVKKMISKDINSILFSSFLIGTSLGLLVAFIIYNIYKSILVDSSQYSFGISTFAILVIIFFIFSVYVVINIYIRIHFRMLSILELILEEQKREFSKELPYTYGIVALILLLGGIVLVLVGPFIFAYGFSTQPPAWWNILYLVTLVGLYMIIKFSIMGSKRKQNKNKYYKHLISCNIVRFNGKQIVKNMCVISLMLIAGLFALSYVPLDVMEDNSIEYVYDVAIPLKGDVEAFDDKYFDKVSSNHNVSIHNYEEIVFMELAGSGVERDWDNDGKLIEDYYELYQNNYYISESEYEKVIGEAFEVNEGEYKLIKNPSATESVFVKFNDLDKVTNINDNTTVDVKYSGTVHNASLTRDNRTFNKYILNDKDYQRLSKNVTSENKLIHIVFNLEGSEKDKLEFSNQIYAELLKNTPNKYAIPTLYDDIQKDRYVSENKEYSYEYELYLRPDNELLLDEWKYYPNIVMIMKDQTSKYSFGMLIIFSYVGILCIIAAFMIEYTRIIVTAHNNKKLFEDLRKLGAKQKYLKECLKEQLNKVVVIPTVVSSFLIFVFVLLLLVGNGGGLSAFDVKIMLALSAIIVVVMILSYILYILAFKKASSILEIVL